ncbi:MAG: bifunctional glutamate N-acetyltransferase/amino-acid acetyltransferase ArgJ [Phycisphaeraceae bacterium]|nr:bifunctional glutamate N-acetyltransferase/amino-acid acetyltransferase ArgJ [Phycisphaeraceae bacterium]
MSITRPMGFRAAAATAGIKPSGKPDLALIVCEPAVPEALRGHGAPIEPRAASAAVFTRNAVVGAPVTIGRRWREAYGTGHARPLRAALINAGCSNAATGEPGEQDARTTMHLAALHLGISPDEVMPSSTGVIGHRLPVGKIEAALPGLVKALARGHDADDAAARAIMTTDLVPKQAHREIELHRHAVHIGAIAKGSGMIAPRLDSASDTGGSPHGTMLAFITTDACVNAACLQLALEHACRESFNCISVDAHPSCSDTVLLLSSGAAPVGPIHRDDPEFHGFRAALTALCQDIATKIVRDGEGATRLFRIEVRGAKSNEDAASMARAVVDSPLVKCAIHGRDPNWGRIVTAAGNAGIAFDPLDASLSIGGVQVYAAGVPTTVGKGDARLAAAMDADPVICELTIGTGPGHAWMLGCDLSADYVRINADYTT